MLPSVPDRARRMLDLLDHVTQELRNAGTVDLAAWQSRYPDLADDLPDLLDTIRDLERLFRKRRQPDTLDEILGLPIAPPEPLPERIGRYEIVRQIGSGGMGTVYKAHDPVADRDLAVKVPDFDVSRQKLAAVRERFTREVRAVAQVTHPNVCPVYDVGEHDGRPFAVMRLVEGGKTVSNILEHQIGVSQAVELIRKAAVRLQVAHEKGIVHRDLKPSNILIDSAGEVHARSISPGDTTSNPSP